jgi:hypothetical protein
MAKKILSFFILPLLLLLSNSPGNPAPRDQARSTREGLNAGPDIITGEIGDLQQYGSSGSQVGLGISTTSCNAGNVPVDFFVLPSTNHPVIPHNFYRMSGGPGNDERFEQIGQSWVKHTFGADQNDDCGFGCTPSGTFTHLGTGCSDTYLSFQNAIQDDLGSRALINPFTGVFQSTANSHNGHTHTGTSHRLLVEASDLNTTLNAGATYYAEVAYITPQEYLWCQSHPGECNMYNNTSYRPYGVTGTTSFIFFEIGEMVRMTPAVHAWTGATINPIEPEPGVDGRAFMAYKVTGPVAGVYHYEYAIYNENLDRAIQSFSIPLGCAVTLTNLGFHAPPNPAGFLNDGTQGGAGFSDAAWTSNQTTAALNWSTETFAQNQNANAIRWGTLYNFRFDSARPPVAADATIGFFKTGAPVTVAILGPNACEGLPSPTPSPTAAPGPAAQAINLSTRMLVQTGDGVGIGGFIITGSTPKHVLLRAIGPSLTQSGVANVLADPAMTLNGSGGTIFTNNNWRDDPAQEAAIIATGIPPSNDLESAIDAVLPPGSYTVVVSGINNQTTGIGLVELYDLDPAGGLSKLANISTRAFVGRGSDITIAGFILGRNSGDDKIIIRGIGPSLVCTGGCSSGLDDPTLELRNSNGALLVSNDNWQDNAAQAAEITAAGLPLPNPLEAGIAATLPPGLYTALLAGKTNNDTGLGLVEVYDRGNGIPPPTPTPGTPTPSPTTSPGITPTPSSTPPLATPTPAVSPTPPPATPTPSPAGACTENFDGASTIFPPGGSWVISTISPFSPPNCLFAPDPASISDQSISSTNISIHSPAAVVSFRNNFDTEHDPPPAEVFWDGYVMEVSTNGGANWTDIIDAGGSFVSGGYTGEIDGTANNPLAGRQAWSGDSGGYILTTINLPASLNGQTINLRFRMGTDEATAAPGVRIDDFSLTGGSCP